MGDPTDQIRNFLCTKGTLFGIASFALTLSGFADLALQTFFIQTFRSIYKAEAGVGPTIPFWVDPLYLTTGVPTYSAIIIFVSIGLIIKWTHLRKLTEGKWAAVHAGPLPFVALIMVPVTVFMFSFIGAFWLTAYSWGHFAH